MPLRHTPQVPAASSAGHPSSPLHQGFFMSSAPHHQQQQYGDAGRPRQEYYAVAALRSAFAQSSIGSSTAAFNAAENLLGMPQFDLPLPSFEMLPPTATATNKRTLRSSKNSELLRQLDPLTLRSSSSDAASLQLPAPPQYQERAHHHGLFLKAEESATLPMRGEAPGSCVRAPATASHAGTNNSKAESPAAQLSKTRIRWTQDLHERFVECVNQLGSADKATPKKILKMMDSDGLTIYHIKSHLQKYRMTKCTPPPSSSSEGKQHEKGGDKENPELINGMHVTEALRVQLDVQRRLQEQLEMQRILQVRIEEQGKMLHKMFELQLKVSGNNAPVAQCRDIIFPAETTEQDDDVFMDIVIDDEMQLPSV